VVGRQQDQPRAHSGQGKATLPLCYCHAACLAEHTGKPPEAAAPPLCTNPLWGHGPSVAGLPHVAQAWAWWHEMAAALDRKRLPMKRDAGQQLALFKSITTRVC